MYLFEFFTNNLFFSEVPVIAGALLLLMVVGWWRFCWLGYSAIVAFCFCLFFFRNPTRSCPEARNNTSVIVCPADGKVTLIEQLPNGGAFGQRISIFLSLFDVHVNWMPISGKIKQIVHTPGSFSPAYLATSASSNERNEIVIKSTTGGLVMVRQIAGIIARRIVCWADQKQIIRAGQKFGMIRFGSRVELLLPEDTEFNVGVGQQVYGGQTVIGWLPR